jgi:uncharacterized protein YbjT (DUF2867 family)
VVRSRSIGSGYPCPVRILIAGATGFVGRALAPALVRAGHDVKAATRRPSRYDGAGEPVGMDVANEGSIKEALEGCGAAYYLVHSMESEAFADRDRWAAERFGEAAAAFDVRVVYLGAMSTDIAASEHLRSRHEVGCILRERADVVELRAAIVLGRGGASFEIMRQLVERLPVMVCPSWVTTRSQPIALTDAVRYLASSLDIPAGAYDIGGADVLTYEQMMRRYATITKRRRLIVKVPVLTPRLSSLWISLITDQPASIARPLVDGLRAEVIVTDDRICANLPFDPMGFDEAVTRALGAG